MENKNWKYITRNISVTSLVDLRIKYKRLTGDNNIPISNLYFGDVKYIRWLESEIVKLTNLKNRLIPFEKLNENPKLIHK